MAEKDYVTLRVEMDLDLYEQIEPLCRAKGLTVETAFQLFLEHIATTGFQLSLTDEEKKRIQSEPPRVRIYEVIEGQECLI